MSTLKLHSEMEDDDDLVVGPNVANPVKPKSQRTTIVVGQGRRDDSYESIVKELEIYRNEKVAMVLEIERLKEEVAEYQKMWSTAVNQLNDSQEVISALQNSLVQRDKEIQDLSNRLGQLVNKPGFRNTGL